MSEPQEEVLLCLRMEGEEVCVQRIQRIKSVVYRSQALAWDTMSETWGM